MGKAIAGLVMLGVFLLIFRDLLTWELVKWLLWALLAAVVYGVAIGLLRRLEVWYRHRRGDDGW